MARGDVTVQPHILGTSLGQYPLAYCATTVEVRRSADARTHHAPRARRARRIGVLC